MNEVMALLIDRLFTFFIALFAAGFAGALTFALIYLVIVYFRLKKREEISMQMVTFEVLLPRDNEIKIDAAEQMFASLHSIKKDGFFMFMDLNDVIAFEIVGTNKDIRFFISAPSYIADLVEKTVYGFYPASEIKRVEEPHIFSEDGKVAYTTLVQKTQHIGRLRYTKICPLIHLPQSHRLCPKWPQGRGDGTVSDPSGWEEMAQKRQVLHIRNQKK